MTSEKLAIRFGLGALKAVGLGVMEKAVEERKKGNKFSDIYDFAERLDPRSINKKSIEALAKSGAFDSVHENRCQIAESFDILSAYATEKKNEASSNQMSLFGGMPEANMRPELKKVLNWNKVTRLQKEFEAFGFFLNEHPLDDHISDLKKRGVIFSDKLERDELNDGDLIRMAGVVAGSKHRSSARGRFAYLTLSDPFGIFETMIFDEALITSARDILVDGSAIAIECGVRKDDGGVRMSVREVKKLDDFLKGTKAQEQDFEDIRKMPARNNQNYRSNNYQNKSGNSNSGNSFQKSPSPANNDSTASAAKPLEKKIFAEVQIQIKNQNNIFSIKALLSNSLAAENTEKFTRVFLVIIDGEKKTKIELPQKYVLGEIEVIRLRNIEKVIAV